ncbi:MAG: putative metal-binding motif-containing protein, partial [Candidatus Aenigmarchaeota archaeon]|nr:putative metal-binding motif-containing protein [Candidatus Aenigmarchaeota archaeon]
SFDSVNIFKPGDYYFAVRDKNQIAERRNFYVALENLLSCDYNGTIIRNNECISKTTNNTNDKPLFCSNQKIVPRCAGPGFCGCPSSDYLCCTNENLAECRGKLGECVLPGSGRVLEKEIKEKEQVVGKEVASGCLVQDKKIPQGVCLNNILDLNLQSSDSLFAQQCSCVDRSAEADLDGDGFDSTNFIGGRDCNDANPNINPLSLESCNDNTGYDGVDNNCDGRIDLDCSSSCDVDNDGYYSVNAPTYLSLFCTVLGNKGGDCDDNNAAKFSGNEEICEDLIDNDCNSIIDDTNVCICKIGEQRKLGGIRNDGIEECTDGKNWRVIKEANENPLVFINTNRGSVESGDVNLNVNEEFEIEVKFLCPRGNCDVEIS